MQTARLLETVSVVAEEPRIFARNIVAELMMMQQSSITGVTSVVDNLPRVSAQEGDAYGFEDWSSNVAVRGFQVTINEAQVGTTIDGFPNGTSDYWSGSKANRVHRPDEPRRRRGLAGDGRHRLAVGRGARRHVRLPDERPGGQADLHGVDHHRRERRPALLHAGRHRTAVGSTETRAWVVAVRQETTDWVEGSARNEPEHVAAKLVSAHGRLDLTSYLSYDSIHEDVYQRLYSALGPLGRRVARRAVPEPVSTGMAGRRGGTTRSGVSRRTGRSAT